MTTRRLLHTLRRNPLTTTIGGSLVGMGSYATLVEYQTENDTNNTHPEHHHHLPRTYDLSSISRYWTNRPLSTTYRIIQIITEATPLLFNYVYDYSRLSSPPSLDRDRQNASLLRQSLTRLGPAFVKAGQQLSIRPDLVPPVVLKELQKLCDAVEPMEDEVAFEIMGEELGEGWMEGVFEGRPMLVAAASLGQVYKAKLKETNETVAIKVQRPDMRRRVSLDLYLLHNIARLMDSFTSFATEQEPYHVNLVDTFAKASYLELDYENEASNQEHFKSELAKRNCKVFIPKVYRNLTTQRILTTEWIQGIKLADAPPDQIRSLIPIGVELFLTQLLDLGHFHADPHPGNLYVTTTTDDNDETTSTLCLLDFGLCATLSPTARHSMTAAIVHLLTNDFDALIETDAKMLGFLPDELDVTELKPILTTILTKGLLEGGSDLVRRKRQLMDISNELNEVFFRYPFSVPPFFALITRGLGLLEGIALSGDPDFDIFQASYPYARRRALELFGIRGLKEQFRLRRVMTSSK